MRVLKGIIRYDGAGFAGWQVQPGLRTVQGVIEEALSTMARRPIRVVAAGRTDAGVHALGQVISCPWDGDQDVDRIRRSLSQLVGPDIRVESIEDAPEDFHATYSAKAKRYAYVFCTAPEPDPFSARYAWHPPYAIDRDLFKRMAQRLVGENDFAGFCSQGSSTKTTVRAIYSVTTREGGIVGPSDARDLWRVEFHGNAFLYKQVRNMVGTLVDIARGHLPPERLDAVLNAPRPYRGFSVPAHGLFLVSVDY